MNQRNRCIRWCIEWLPSVKRKPLSESIADDKICDPLSPQAQSVTNTTQCCRFLVFSSKLPNHPQVAYFLSCFLLDYRCLDAYFIFFGVDASYHQKLSLSYSVSAKKKKKKMSLGLMASELKPALMTHFFSLHRHFFCSWSPHTSFDLMWAIRMYWRRCAPIKILYYESNESLIESIMLYHIDECKQHREMDDVVQMSYFFLSFFSFYI